MKGGKRKGAGGVKDATRPNFNAYWTPQEIQDFMDEMKVRAKTSDKVAIWVGDHLFGKAVQPIGNDNGQPLIIQFDNAFKTNESV